ncbi:hypothetical protein CBG55_10285 [Prevotella intermedia]|nr:hypothetical protein CBG55_10285 [Prevotella intermedia]
MMILTKGRCDPPFLSQLGFGEGVRGWWVGVLGFLYTLELVGEGGLVAVEIGALDFLGVLELGVEGIFVVGASRCHRGSRWARVGVGKGFGGYMRFRGFSRNMRSKFKTSINIQKFNSADWYM